VDSCTVDASGRPGFYLAGGQSAGLNKKIKIVGLQLTCNPSEKQFLQGAANVAQEFKSLR